jgi:hypothetical protein
MPAGMPDKLRNERVRAVGKIDRERGVGNEAALPAVGYQADHIGLDAALPFPKCDTLTQRSCQFYSLPTLSQTRPESGYLFQVDE